MWDGVLLFDSEYFNENNLTKLFDWNYIPGVSDVGGSTNKLISLLNKQDYDFFEFYNYNNLDGDILQTHLNGNIQYYIDIEKGVFNNHLPQMGNRSFPYEDEYNNYQQYLCDKFLDIKKNFIDGYEFQNPISIDIIQFKNDDAHGWINLVDILHYDEFKELFDVDVQTNPLLNNQYITYNSTSTKFVNSNLAISNDANPILSNNLIIRQNLF